MVGLMEERLTDDDYSLFFPSGIFFSGVFPFAGEFFLF